MFSYNKLNYFYFLFLFINKQIQSLWTVCVLLIDDVQQVGGQSLGSSSPFSNELLCRHLFITNHTWNVHHHGAVGVAELEF